MFCHTVHLEHEFSTGRSQHVKSGGPRTSVYFKNGFACQIRLRNTGLCGLPYGPAPVYQRRNGLFY